MNSTSKSHPPTTKLIVGSLVLVLSFLSPLCIPWLADSTLSDGIKTILSGLLVFGIPELGMLAAVAIMGKEGYEWLKRRLLVLLRIYGPPQVVSASRYKFGILLFSMAILVGFVLPYLLYFFPAVSITRLSIFYIAMGCDVLLIVSLFVLGGGFWDKLRGLFNHNAFIKISD